MSAFFTSIGQLLWKLGNEKFLFIILGFVFYGIGALIMIISYKYGNYSVIQPFISISYVFSLLLGSIILKETITIYKVSGISIIIIGVIFIAIGDD